MRSDTYCYYHEIDGDGEDSGIDDKLSTVAVEAAVRTSSGEALQPLVDMPYPSTVVAVVASEMVLVDSPLLQPVVVAAVAVEKEEVDCRRPKAENPRIQIES